MTRKKKRLNTFKTKVLESISCHSYDDNEITFDEMYEKMMLWREEFGDKYSNLSLNFHLNWDACYYEGDTPEVQIDVTGDIGHIETDEEYEKRCGYAPADGWCIK